MRVILEENNELLSFTLPNEVNGNYWIKNSKKDNLVNIVSENNKWVIHNNADIKLLKNISDNVNEVLTNVNQIESCILEDFLSLYLYETETKMFRRIYFLPTYDNTMIQLVIDFSKVSEIIIGNDKKATINYSNDKFVNNQIVISFNNNLCVVKNNNIKIPMFINNINETEKILFNGDMVFIDGLSFCIIGNLLLINNPSNKMFYDSLKLAKRLLPNNSIKDYSSEQETFVEVFNNRDYFQRPPRFKRSIEEKEFKIDPPGNSFIKQDEMPLIYTMGPMMLMAMTSLITGLTSIMNVITGKSGFKENAVGILTTITMLGGTLVFPFLQKSFTKNTLKKKERKRRRKYKNYIEKKKNDILQEIEIQRQILIENNLGLEDVCKVILNRQRTLWDRKIEHSDFLNIRLGIGTFSPKIKIDVPEEHFTMEEDDMLDIYNELFTTVKDMENVPVTVNLVEKRLTGVVGSYSYVKQFLDGVMLQLLAFHSYDMLKIVVLTSNEKKNTWLKYRNIPHFWNNEKTFRFIGIDTDNINKISNELIYIFNERIGSLDEKDNESTDLYKMFSQYYLIITDEVELVKSTSIYNELMKEKRNIGMSFLFVTEKLDSLPNECSFFINVEQNNSGIFENELISTKQRMFVPDIPNFNMNSCYLTLCNIPVDIAAGKFVLPKTYSFLEMYDVGNVNQLNIMNRWKNNNIIQSLAAPVGINEQGELFKIDLHEKAHGPHGLVAGMTGSGKSEWIISYVLSMCINYHPDEVQFVLIDYKGGGLAGTFENKETGFKLPHLAGTITNLDVSEINRSLVSINSELKRRQSLFNAARDKLGESSVDIYKYQRWYREGKISEPISHLFIVSDEFAELKAQQPEFMAELISTARIGRSLGVHLILATQKPSGVVDDQIWSNSKFRVCLKVQDKSDSNEMIRVPDAAMLKEAGRFYLQVGYNEFFAKGQSAYAGSLYYESDRHKKTVDTDIVFVDDVGEVYKQINSEKKVVSAVFKGEELPNILKEIVRVADSVTTNVKKLWLDAIPKEIYLDELLKKYNYTKENYVLNPVIGEYDAPKYQKQSLLTLPLSKGGNTLIYGVQGSGKEDLLMTMLYSLMTTHYYQEVNVYILDFGAEILNCFKNTPIVGDVITSNDNDKLKKYFNYVNEEIEKRKKIFQEYGGDYYSYITKSGNVVPVILSVINNYDNFIEFAGDYMDLLVKFTREAEKYGILFVITSNSVNSISFKLSQNFKQSICLQLNDNYDYKSVFGHGINVVPQSTKGRGLMSVNEDVFEFQTAKPINTNDIISYIINVSNQLAVSQKGRAISIKTLPEKVDFNFVEPYYNTLKDLPIGVYTESLEICKYDMLGNKFNIVTGEDSDLLSNFAKSLVELISVKKETLKAIVFDGGKYFESVKTNVTYVESNFMGSLNSFSKFVDKISEKTKQSLVIFTGMNEILKSNVQISQFLDDLFNRVNNIDKINVMFIDTVDEIKNYSMDRWFSNNILKDNAIFIGSGIDNQYLIDIKKRSRELREDIPDNYAYVIKKGKPYKIKIIEIDNINDY